MFPCKSVYVTIACFVKLADFDTTYVLLEVISRWDGAFQDQG